MCVKFQLSSLNFSIYEGSQIYTGGAAPARSLAEKFSYLKTVLGAV